MDEQAIFFTDAAELIAQVRKAKKSGAWADIGKAGRERCRDLFSEVCVAKYLVDFATESSLAAYELGQL